MIEGKDLFDFSHSLAGERLQCAEMPWEALAQISAWAFSGPRRRAG